VAYDEFMWHSLRELQVYNEAHKLKIKEMDYLNYLTGEYVYDALVAALGGMFAKKGTKAPTYIEMREKPILDKIDEKQEEVVDEQTAYENWRMQRKIDKLNWDLAQIYAKKGG